MGRLSKEVHMGSKTTVGVHAGVKEETDLDLFVGREAKVEAADALPSDMMIDDLMFSDGVFPSLPDFPCLSSPLGSPSMSTSAASRQPKAACFSNKSSASSSSSSSYSSPWSSLKVSPESHVMQVVPANDDRISVSTEALGLLSPESDGLDILGAVDIWESSEPGGCYDPSSFFLGEGVGGGCGVDGDEPDRQTITVDEAEFLGAGRECSSEDLAKIFFDWLKNNKDSISPEDLRSIKLKRSTIECAASRLGGGKQGRVQLLKLILAWVQNHHLQRKRRRSRGVTSSDRYANQDITANTVATSTGQSQISYHPICPAVVTTIPNTNHYDSTSSNTWMPYASEQLSFSTSTAAYRDEPSVPPPYHYYHNQPYSQLPPSDFHSAEQTSVTWHQGFSPASSAVHYSPFSPTPAPTSLQTEAAYHAGFAPHFTGAQPAYSPASGVARLSSATKEARKNRMARHKRSSLHNNRSQQQQHQQQGSDAVTAMDEGSSSPALSNAQNARSWSVWSSSLPASSHQITSQTDNPALLPTQLLLPPAPQPPPAGENPLRHLSPAEKRRGLKSERNMRFLLQKVLKQSDVGSLGRIVLPKKEAEIHLPELDARDGISIEMEDIGTSRVWNMRYRFWPNNKSRMYLLENTGDFVRANGLQEGDFIVIYSDVKCGKYMIRGVKVRQAMEAKGASSRNSVKVHSSSG